MCAAVSWVRGLSRSPSLSQSSVDGFYIFPHDEWRLNKINSCGRLAASEAPVRGRGLWDQMNPFTGKSNGVS